MNSKHLIKNAVVLGLALFAMFFGAGNLIFPPAIGVEGGKDWIVGFLAYFVADVGLAIVSVVAMLKANGVMSRVTGSVGRIPAIALNTATIICIGPLVGIPRTAATSFSMGSMALFGGEQSLFALPLFSLAFFALVFVVVLKPGKVVSNIGRILTPVLLAVLAILIVVGIFSPSAQAGEPLSDTLVQMGVINGYQTMDVIAALAFSIIVVETVRGFGYTSGASKGKAVAIACLVSAGLLFAVYGGLAYLGATTGQLWAAEFMSGSLNQAGLLTNIATSVLGNAGAALLIVVVLFACLTTAIGLVSACAEYLHNLIGSKLSYRALALIICVLAFVVCNAGLDQIISIAVPILLLVYPVTMFLVVASLVRKDGSAESIACKLGAVVAFGVSLCTVLTDTLGVTSLGFIHNLPLDGIGVNWLFPTLLAALVGWLIEKAFCKKH